MAVALFNVANGNLLFKTAALYNYYSAYVIKLSELSKFTSCIFSEVVNSKSFYISD
jgi:hypothetical protein